LDDGKAEHMQYAKARALKREERLQSEKFLLPLQDHMAEQEHNPAPPRKIVEQK
jgi:hypothetical protein